MINVLGVGAGIRGGGQGTLGRQGRQEEVSGWSGCYRQRTAAQRTQVLGQHQSAARQPGWTLRSMWFRLGLGAGFVLVLMGVLFYTLV